MTSSNTRTIPRLAGGVVLTGVLVSATIGSSALLADVGRVGPRIPGGYQQSTYASKWKLEKLYGTAGAAQLIQNWDCGCPPKSSRIKIADLKTELQQKFKTWRKIIRRRLATYPTRCLYENHSSNLAGSWRPVNNYGDAWPDFGYPKGFPSDSRFPRPRTFDRIPFPGWPHAYILEGQRAVWDDAPRKEYRNEYVKASSPKKGPAKIAGNPPSKKSSLIDGWVSWQVHHIMERRFGGENVWGNLVPMWSGRSTGKQPNEHSRYTNWWHRVTLDYDVMQRDASDPDTCAICTKKKQDTHRNHSFMTIKQMQGRLAKCRSDLR